MHAHFCLIHTLPSLQHDMTAAVSLSAIVPYHNFPDAPFMENLLCSRMVGVSMQACFAVIADRAAELEEYVKTQDAAVNKVLMVRVQH